MEKRVVRWSKEKVKNTASWTSHVNYSLTCLDLNLVCELKSKIIK